MRILVLNSGSSSIKFQLFDMDTQVSLASGLVEQIGENNSQAKLKTDDGRSFSHTGQIKNHEDALTVVTHLFEESGTLHDLSELDGIGHRVVQGGNIYVKPVIVDDKVLSDIHKLSALAPLHNPAHAVGIETAIKQSNGVPQVVVFDNAYHSTMPDFAYTYAIPYKYHKENAVRRYGFHGTSHFFVSKKAAEYLGKDYTKFNAVSLHLGNGASATAIKNGMSYDTSMGLTPLEGLVMGTRSGDIDPAVLFYLAREKGVTSEQFDTILNKQSGMKGICGSNDMREILERVESGDKLAELAFNMFCHRLKKYVGSYMAILGRVDALIFTGGIGENASAVRAKVCQELEHFGIEFDVEANKKRDEEVIEISLKHSKVKVLVVATNEELEIAQETQRLIQSKKN